MDEHFEENKKNEDENAEEKKDDIKKDDTKKEEKNDNGNKPQKSKKVYIGIIVALFVVIGGLIAFILLGQGKGKKSDDNKTETQTEAEVKELENDTEEPEASEEASDEKESTGEKADCYVTVTKGNGWENGSKYSCQFDGKIYNKSQSDISDWKVTLDGVTGAEIDSSWNGTYEISGDQLSITAVDYNGTVGKGQSVDFGFILNVDSESAAGKIAGTAKLYVNGELYVSAPEKDTESESEETTEKDTTEAEKPAQTETGTPLANHGKLSVKGTDLVDKNGEKYQLKGVSTHGLSWFPDYVNKEAFQTFRDDWGANLIRLAMYTHENGGYCTDGNKENLKKLIDNGVNYANELGMYVIIDWHVLQEQSPLTYKDEAISFFEEMSAKYKDYDNVLYEICNEPNGGTTWADVKKYAEEVIPVIRKNDKDAVIIVGTPTWSQDADIAADDPIEGYDNIMYTIHFYAATHKENIRNKLKTARDKGLAIFISEFSICDASGNGGIDYGEAEKWMDLIREYNLSYAGWNVSNKDETSSLIKSSCTKTSGWTEDDLSETGIWLRKQIKGQ